MKQTCKQLSISPHPMGRGAIKLKALGKKTKEIGKILGLFTQFYAIKTLTFCVTMRALSSQHN